MKSASRIIKSDNPTKELFRKQDIYWRDDGTEGVAPFPARARRLTNEHGIELKGIRIHEATAPWIKKRTNICLKLKDVEKKYNHPAVTKQKTNEHINKKGRHYGL